MTIKLQCKYFTSIRATRRGQTPNNRMIIMCNYFNTPGFVGKKKIVIKYAVCECV